MKTCSNCGELNGESRSICFKCNAKLGVGSMQDLYGPKKCLKCNITFAMKANVCNQCGGALVVYEGRPRYAKDSYTSSSYSTDSASPGLYILAALIPLLGIILCCIYIGRKEDSLGKKLIVTAIVAGIVVSIISYLVILNAANNAVNSWNW